MAQTGYTPILIYASGTATNTPSAANLTSGSTGAELAINYTDGKLFYKDNSGNVQVLATKAATSGTFPAVIATETITGSLTAGAFSYGTLGYSDVNIFGSFTSSVNTYNQIILQNTSSGAAASTDYVVSNNLGTASTYYGDFGMNSSAFSGTGALGGANNVYVTSTSADLAIGTTTSNAIHFVIGGAATDAMTIATTGIVSFPTTGAITLPAGTTAQEPTGVAGMLRFNTTTTQFEGYNGSAWASVGGAALSNDTTSTTPYYPLFAHATSGTALTIYTSNTQYLFKPSTGELQAPILIANNGLHVNSKTVATSYSVPSGSSAMSAGPMTVASGQSVTLPSGSRWVIL